MAASISPTVGVIGEQASVAGTGFLSGATVTLDGVEARVIRLTSTSIIAITPVHVAGTVDVVVTNPGGQRATLTGGYTFVPFGAFSVAASPNVVTSGGQLTMSWVAPSGRGCLGGGDYVTLAHVGDPDITEAANGHSDLWYEHLCAAASGTLRLPAPPEPGQYEFRYMVGDAGVVARSSPVTVNAASASLSP
ncbi:MAG: IPT/TIG domain-containing protein [Acidobacteriota bacterium]